MHKLNEISANNTCENYDVFRINPYSLLLALNYAIEGLQVRQEEEDQSDDIRDSINVLTQHQINLLRQFRDSPAKD